MKTWSTPTLIILDSSIINNNYLSFHGFDASFYGS